LWIAAPARIELGFPAGSAARRRGGAARVVGLVLCAVAALAVMTSFIIVFAALPVCGLLAVSCARFPAAQFPVAQFRAAGAWRSPRW
jgi:hypothetical protein